MSEKAKIITVKGALVVPPELAQKILNLFNELPRKHSSLIDPVVEEMKQCHQADVVLTIEEEVKK